MRLTTTLYSNQHYLSPNFGKPLIYAQQSFCNKTHLKTMGKKCKLKKKNYASFYCLTGGRIKPPMAEFWASSCSPAHREYKNCHFISIHGRISKLQMFVYVAVTTEFTNDNFSVNVPSFSNTEAFLGKTYTLVDAQIHGEHNEPRFDFVRHCISKL